MEMSNFEQAEEVSTEEDPLVAQQMEFQKSFLRL